MSGPRERLALLLVLGFGFALRVATALSWPNVHFPDEIFQTLEPAHRLAFGYGVVSWEWRIGARSWLLPGFLAGVMQLAAPLGPGSTGYLLGTTLVLAALGTLPVWAAWRLARRTCDAGPALLAAFACAVWCELVHFAPKALNEVVAGHLLAAAVALAPLPGAPRGRPVLCGLLFGLCVALRPQLGPGVLAGLAFCARRDPRRAGLPLFGGAAATFGAAGLLDAATWGTPFHSSVRNTFENIVSGRSLAYGTDPIYGYLKSYLRLWTVGSVPIFALAVWGARRLPLPLLIAAVTLLVHSVIPHKEWRFVHPVSVLVLLGAAVASAELVTRLARRGPWFRRTALPLAALLWTLASLAVVPRFSPQHAVGGDRQATDVLYWSRNAGAKRSFTELSLRGDVCGVALLGLHWAFSGGYTHLHHDVPIFQVGQPNGLPEVSAHANHLVAQNLDAPGFGAYTRERCFDGSHCLYRRPGGCAAKPGYDLNAELAARGE